MASTIDEYIAEFPAKTRAVLEDMRRIIRAAAPEATEKISYAMPTFVLNGNLVHFAGFERHVGFYPTPSAVSAFAGDLAGYKTSKGAVQFPLEEPLPEDLITRMVRFRVGEATKD